MVERVDRTIVPSPEAPQVPELITVEDPGALLAEDFRAVSPQGTIRIYTHEGVLFNDSRVTDALRFAKQEQGAAIRVSMGPIAVVDDNGVNGLLQLQEEGVIDRLQVRRGRLSSPAYHVVDVERGFRYYGESFQNPELGLQRERIIDNPAHRNAWDIAYHSRGDFDAYESAEDEMSSGVDDTLLPLMTTVAIFERLAEEADQSDFGLQYALPSQLLSLPSAQDGALASYVPPNGR